MPLNLPAMPTAAPVRAMPFSRAPIPLGDMKSEDPELREGRQLDNEYKRMRNNAFDPEEAKRKEDFSKKSNQDSIALTMIKDLELSGDELVEAMRQWGAEDPEQYSKMYDKTNGTIEIPITHPESGDSMGVFEIRGRGVGKGALTKDQLGIIGRAAKVGAATGDFGSVFNETMAKLFDEHGIVGEMKDPYEDIAIKEQIKANAKVQTQEDIEEIKTTEYGIRQETKLEKEKELAEYKDTLSQATKGKMTDAQKQKFDITISNIEDALLNPTEEDEDPTASVDMFNEHSDKDYYYKFTPAEEKPGMFNDEDAMLEKIPRKNLSQDKAVQYLKQADGDREKAERRAKRDGYKF